MVNLSSLLYDPATSLPYCEPVFTLPLASLLCKGNDAGDRVRAGPVLDVVSCAVDARCGLLWLVTRDGTLALSMPETGEPIASMYLGAGIEVRDATLRGEKLCILFAGGDLITVKVDWNAAVNAVEFLLGNSKLAR